MNSGEPQGNLQSPATHWHDPGMAQFPQSQSGKRSPRVRVPNEELVRFKIDGTVFPAVLHRLSLTGGLAEFAGPVAAGNVAEVQLNTKLGPVSGLVEFLRQQNSRPGSHPFRFIALADGDYRRLNTTLMLMRRLGLGVDAN
jgi:hypothetical protein